MTTAAAQPSLRPRPHDAPLLDLLCECGSWHETLEAVANGFDASEHAARAARSLRERGIDVSADVVIGLATARVDREREPRRELLRRAHEMLFARERVAEPYPVEGLGPLAEAAQAVARLQQIDPAIVGQSLLGAASLLAQRCVNAQTLDGPRPASLFLLTIAGSGDGKDSADRTALARVREYQRSLARDHRAGEPPPLYLLASDATTEGLRREFAAGAIAMMLSSTEAAAILAGYGFSAEQRTKSAAVLSSVFDRGMFSVARATSGRTERHGIRLAAHLLVQPAAAGDVLADPALTSIGFWPRWLLAWPAEPEPRKFRPPNIAEDHVIRGYWGRCDELLACGAPVDCDELPVIPLSSGAQRVLAAAFERFEVEARRGELRHVKPFAIRAVELACRVAAVLAAWADAREVDATLARGAVALIEHSIVNWSAAIAGRADPVASDAFTLLQWLIDQGRPVRLADVLRLGPARLRSASRRDAAAERLADLGLAVRGDGCIVAAGTA